MDKMLVQYMMIKYTNTKDLELDALGPLFFNIFFTTI